MRRVVALALVPSMLGGCGHTCTLMFAPSSLGIEFEADGWAPGTYQIEVSGYGRTALCVVTLPLAEADDWNCTDHATLMLSEGEDAVERMSLVEFAPDSFVVQIVYDYELTAEQWFTPDYEVDEPNGPGCGERRVATVTMQL